MDSSIPLTVRIASRALFAGVFVAVLIVATACGDDATEAGRTTGVTELDALVAEVESHDPGGIRESLVFQTLPCTAAAGEGSGPKCESGEADGTDVQVFEFYTCAVDWRRASGVDDALAEMMDIAPIRYAAFEPQTDNLIDAPIVLVFEGPDPRLDGAAPRGVAVGVDDGMITTIRLACGAGDGGASLLPAGQSEFLLNPPSDA